MQTWHSVQLSPSFQIVSPVLLIANYKINTSKTPFVCPISMPPFGPSPRRKWVKCPSSTPATLYHIISPIVPFLRLSQQTETILVLQPPAPHALFLSILIHPILLVDETRNAVFSSSPPFAFKQCKIHIDFSVHSRLPANFSSWYTRDLCVKTAKHDPLLLMPLLRYRPKTLMESHNNVGKGF